jgi:hypothetical protein
LEGFIKDETYVEGMLTRIWSLKSLMVYSSIEGRN